MPIKCSSKLLHRKLATKNLCRGCFFEEDFDEDLGPLVYLQIAIFPIVIPHCSAIAVLYNKISPSRLVLGHVFLRILHPPVALVFLCCCTS